MPVDMIAQVLAAAGSAEQLLSRVLPWLAALIGGVVVLVAGVGCYRRRTRRREDRSGLAWTLHELREMQAQGDLSDAEYQHLRARLLGPIGSSDKTGGSKGQ